ncbi:MAG TPA: PAS domain S-box protein, partial [Gemmatimonadaceae bacterium]|nr:PAS domain S-box protein [Gemmatimonadaceae bacterium]
AGPHGFYHILADRTSDLVMVFDAEGRATFLSPSVHRVLGYDADALGSAVDRYELVHPDDRPFLVARRADVRRGTAYTHNFRLRHAAGHWVRLETSVTPVLDARRQASGLCVIARDVTEQYRTGQALRASEERSRLLVERAALGIYHSTGAGRFLDVNPALVAMLGYDSAEELLAVDIATDVFAEAEERNQLLAQLQEGGTPDWMEVTWRRRDGTPIDVRLSARLVRDADGALLYCEGMAENVTERQRREALLRRNERMASLGQMLAGVAHELNNPLAAVIGFAQLLRRGAMAEEDRQAVETIDHEAQRAAQIVRDLLSFARRRHDSSRELVNVNDVVQYVMAARRYAMETGGVRQRLQLADHPLLVVADRPQLEQALFNLVVNAQQALEGADSALAAPGGQITVRTARQGDGIVIEVADDGPGIRARDLPHIWDPFWTTKADGEGTGLGLPVVHGIVTSHGGSIDVDSALGSGTRVRVVLPAPSEVELATRRPALAREQAPQPLDILVVDDDPTTAAFVQRYLAGRGHAVVTASTGARALRLAAGAPFDIVLCNATLAEPDGAAMVAELRRLAASAETRFIPVGERGGAAETPPLETPLMKPYELDVLRRAVER